MLIMKIRPATVNDVEAIAAVIEPFVDDVVVTEEGRERFKPDMLKNIFQRPLIHYFVAEINEEIVGNLAYIAPSHVMHYFLKPEYHGQGYGRQMWDFLEQEILKNDPDIITINSSHYALDIYKKYGFEVVGALTEKWGIQFIPMQKLLKPKNLE